MLAPLSRLAFIIGAWLVLGWISKNSEFPESPHSVPLQAPGAPRLSQLKNIGQEKKDVFLYIFQASYNMLHLGRQARPAPPSTKILASCSGGGENCFFMRSFFFFFPDRWPPKGETQGWSIEKKYVRSFQKGDSRGKRHWGNKKLCGGRGEIKKIFKEARVDAS